jgi:hypothetical protein
MNKYTNIKTYKTINTNNTNNTNNSIIDDKLRKQLIGRIYAETDLSKFRYEMLTYEADLQKILKNKYFVSINFCGLNSLLVFTKVQDKFYSFTVERQTLSYNFSKVDFSKVNINLVNIPLDDNIYNGTIFEGILIKRSNNSDVFVISDVYKFCGRDMTKDKLNLKLLNVVEYLKINYDNEKDNNLDLEVNKIFELNNFDNFIDNILPKVKNLKYRGICFYPEISEIKLIFNLNNSNQSNQINQFNQNNSNSNQFNKFNQNNSNSNQFNKFNQNNSNQSNQINQFNQNNSNFNQNNSNSNQFNQNNSNNSNNSNNIKENKKYKYINQSDNDVFAVLDLKQTENPDVYKLYSVQKEIINKKILFKKINMGIAHIKGIDTSHMLKKILKDRKSILMKCKFNNDNSKWEPIEEEKKERIPTLIDDIESQLVQMELSDDEN